MLPDEPAVPDTAVMRMQPCWMFIAVSLAGGLLTVQARNVELEPATTPAGYVARLLINEVPFPGEHCYKSEKDTEAAMLAVLWVIHSRIDCIPPGYTQEEVAGVRSRSVIDVITVGGVKGQVDGFYRDSQGKFVAVSRVHKRVDNLLKIANQGQPGRFAQLMNYAQSLASRYFQSGPAGGDIFAELSSIGSTRVTGRSYAWMADYYRDSPGGNFVHIPNSQHGALGGNRFYTLKKNPK